MCHSESSSVSNRNRETKGTAGDNREGARAWATEDVHSQHNKASDVHWTKFTDSETPSIIYCLHCAYWCVFDSRNGLLGSVLSSQCKALLSVLVDSNMMCWKYSLKWCKNISVPQCVSVLGMICIHKFIIVYSAAWRTYKQAGHSVLCVCLLLHVCVCWRTTGCICVCVQYLCVVCVFTTTIPHCTCPFVCKGLLLLLLCVSCLTLLPSQLTCAGADPCVPSCGSLICCNTPKHSMTHSPIPTHTQTAPLGLPFFPPSIYKQTSLALGDNLFSCLASFSPTTHIDIHCHISP